MVCKHIKREGESCPKNNNCRYPFCLADRNNNTTYCFKCGKTIDFHSNSGLCLTCSISTSTEGIQTPPSSGEGSDGKKNINTNDLPSNEDNQQVLHKAHVMRSLALLQQVLNRQAKAAVDVDNFLLVVNIITTIF